MEQIKKFTTLIQNCTQQSATNIQQQSYREIDQLIKSRVDMSKHFVAAFSKRISIKNSKVLLLCFDLFEYICCKGQLSLYTQVCTKEFFFKINNILNNKQLDANVSQRILETVKCMNQLFETHQDLLPQLFQFLEGLSKENYQLPTSYSSQYTSFQNKTQNKAESQVSSKKQLNQKSNQADALYQIRQKVLITNQLIDNSNPDEPIQQNSLIFQMINDIKESQKTVTKLINNQNQKIVEFSLALNDDLQTTFKRYQFLKNNQKPEPFNLTQLISEAKYSTSVKQQQKKQAKNDIDLMNFQQPKESNTQEKQNKSVNIFDLIDTNQAPTAQTKQTNKQKVNKSFKDILSQNGGNQNVYQNFSYNSPDENQYRTDLDIKQYGGNKGLAEKLTDLSDLI